MEELRKEFEKEWEKIRLLSQEQDVAEKEDVWQLFIDLSKQSLTEEITDKEVEDFIQSLPWDYKDTANSGFGLEDAKCLVGGNIRNFWQWIKNKQLKQKEETEEGFKEFYKLVSDAWMNNDEERMVNVKERLAILYAFGEIFTHYKLIKREN